MLKSYLPGINTPIFLKRHYANIFSEKFVDKLHDCTEKNTHVIQPPKVSNSLFVKTNVTLVKKQNQILQISVLDLHNDMILTIPQGGCFGERTVDGKVCIVDTSLRKDTPK